MEDGISRGLQHHHKTCCEKGGRHGRQACMVQKWSSLQGRCFRTGGLVYDKKTETQILLIPVTNTIDFSSHKF